MQNRRAVLFAFTALAGAAFVPSAFAQAGDDVSMETAAFANRDGKDLLLDIYRPKAATQPLPVIIFLHGGGWSGGTRTTGPDFKRFFASRGFAMVAIDYRLTPAIVFPANLEDVKASIRWVRANAAKYGLDKNRIGLWGTSAGGYLAAMAGVTPQGQFEGADNLDQSSKVVCVLDAYGPTFFTTMDAETQAEKAGLQPVAAGLVGAPPVGSRAQATPPAAPAAGATATRVVEGGATVARLHDAADSAESKLMGAPIQSIPDKVAAASPLSFVKANAPPYLIMHGMADDSVPHTQSVKLYEALAKAGNEVTLRLIDGLPHTFFNRSNLDELAGPFRMSVRSQARGGKEQKSVETAKAFEVAEAFFTKHLKPARK